MGTGPTAAEAARTAVASARTGALITYPRHGRPLLTSVALQEQDGDVVLHLPEGSAAARLLDLRPLATVRMAPVGCDPTSLQGGVRRRAERTSSGLLTYALAVAGVRLGTTWSRCVPVEDYRRAEPDPLRCRAAEVVAHLATQHAEALTACLQAQGHHRALWVHPRRLDRYGLELSVLEADGVALVRLNFPTPVRSVRELSSSLHLALRGRCPDCRPG